MYLLMNHLHPSGCISKHIHFVRHFLNSSEETISIHHSKGKFILIFKEIFDRLEEILIFAYTDTSTNTSIIQNSV